MLGPVHAVIIREGGQKFGGNNIRRNYKCGVRTEPCNAPACVSVGVKISPLTETLKFLFERKDVISLNIMNEKFNFSNLFYNLRCHVASQDFSISKNTAAI